VRDISTLFEKKPQLSFTEFVVFDYGNGTREVMFGWSTSSGSPANQDCIATTDAAVVAFFEAFIAWVNSAATPKTSKVTSADLSDSSEPP
jgi:hypothetical protein